MQYKIRTIAIACGVLCIALGFVGCTGETDRPAEPSRPKLSYTPAPTPSGPSDLYPPTTPPVDKRKRAEITLDYLEKDGRLLRDLAIEVRSLPDQITDTAVQDRCRTLAEKWEKKYGRAGPLVTGNDARIADQKLLDLEIEQLAMVRSTFVECADGKKAEARARSARAAALTGEIDHRIQQLERER